MTTYVCSTLPPSPITISATVDVPARSRCSRQWTPMRVTVLPQQQTRSWMHSLTQRTFTYVSSVQWKLNVCVVAHFPPIMDRRQLDFSFSIMHRNRLRPACWGLRQQNNFVSQTRQWIRLKTVMNRAKFLNKMMLTYHSNRSEGLKNLAL